MEELNALPELTSLEHLLPPFERDGGLPPGDYAPTRQDFRSRFVGIGDADRRQTIYDGWQRLCTNLLQAGVPPEARQLLDGSYVTDKPLPADLDIAVEVVVSGELQDFVGAHPRIFQLLGGPKAKAPYHCDAYPILVVDQADPNYQSITVRAVRYWTKWFGRDRQNRPKGRVWGFTGERP